MAILRCVGPSPAKVRLTTALTTVVPAEGRILGHILDATYATWHDGLSRPAYGRLAAAEAKTTWGRSHQRRFALVEGNELLASAKQYRLTGILDQRPIQICGIGSLFTEVAHRGRGHARALVERLLAEAARNGADAAILFSAAGSTGCVRNGFETVTMMENELSVVESPRHGAPMTLVRGGEERDLPAIVAMGRVRADPFRFHLDRDADFVQHAVTKKRLLAGLGKAGSRQLQFFIAEEGISAAAYVVLSVVGNTWRIEECGDRDPSGARVGAILQALIAREPSESPPLIRGWLPPGFVPPQVTIVSATHPTQVMMMRLLGPTTAGPRLSGADVLYWPSDVF